MQQTAIVESHCGKKLKGKCKIKANKVGFHLYRENKMLRSRMDKLIDRLSTFPFYQSRVFQRCISFFSLQNVLYCQVSSA